MSFVALKELPGQQDVNDEFSAKGLADTLADFKKLGRSYQFGDLSAKHNALDPKRAANWRKLINTAYPEDVREILKTVINQALTHTDSEGRPMPIPIQWVWKGRSGILKVTYNHKAPKYKIELGFPSPLGDRLSKRPKQGAK